jgi:hypothetical protein
MTVGRAIYGALVGLILLGAAYVLSWALRAAGF